MACHDVRERGIAVMIAIDLKLNNNDLKLLAVSEHTLICHGRHAYVSKMVRIQMINTHEVFLLHTASVP